MTVLCHDLPFHFRLCSISEFEPSLFDFPFVRTAFLVTPGLRPLDPRSPLPLFCPIRALRSAANICGDCRRFSCGSAQWQFLLIRPLYCTFGVFSQKRSRRCARAPGSMRILHLNLVARSNGFGFAICARTWRPVLHAEPDAPDAVRRRREGRRNPIDFRRNRQTPDTSSSLWGWLGPVLG